MLLLSPLSEGPPHLIPSWYRKISAYHSDSPTELAIFLKLYVHIVATSTLL